MNQIGLRLGRSILKNHPIFLKKGNTKGFEIEDR
jgi:hypothetical protein